MWRGSWAARRGLQQRLSALLSDKALRDCASARLKKRWPPQQLSNRLAKDFPDSPEMRVSTETIHQAVHVHVRGGLGRALAEQASRSARLALGPRPASQAQLGVDAPDLSA